MISSPRYSIAKRQAMARHRSAPTATSMSPSRRRAWSSSAEWRAARLSRPDAIGQRKHGVADVDRAGACRPIIAIHRPARRRAGERFWCIGGRIAMAAAPIADFFIDGGVRRSRRRWPRRAVKRAKPSSHGAPPLRIDSRRRWLDDTLAGAAVAVIEYNIMARAAGAAHAVNRRAQPPALDAASAAGDFVRRAVFREISNGLLGLAAHSAEKPARSWPVLGRNRSDCRAPL